MEVTIRSHDLVLIDRKRRKNEQVKFSKKVKL